MTSVYRAEGEVQSGAFHLEPVKGIADGVSLPICLPGMLFSKQEEAREIWTLILYSSDSYR